MEVIKPDQKAAEDEKTQEQKDKEEIEAYQEALKIFKLSPFYPHLMKMIDEKISDVTDTRMLAKSFGQIKAEVIGELGTLGIASLMAAQPLEEMKEELS